METKNPAGCSSSANRVRGVYAFRSSIDTTDLTENAPESLAGRSISQRFGIPASTARLLAELAGLGPRADREAVFPFTTVSQPLAGSLTHGA